jgi:hypothetical protein
MNLRQQIIQDRVEALAHVLQIDPDAAFVRPAFSLGGCPRTAILSRGREIFFA